MNEPIKQAAEVAVSIPEFEALRKRAEEMAQTNALTVFDYRSKQGNKDFVDGAFT